MQKLKGSTKRLRCCENQSARLVSRSRRRFMMLTLETNLNLRRFNLHLVVLVRSSKDLAVINGRLIRTIRGVHARRWSVSG